MDFIFGYGSIINDDSRYGTLKNDPDTHNLPLTKTYHRNEFSSYEGGNICGDETVAISVSSLFAKRCWNFRCPTGFTALGLVLESHDEMSSQEILFGRGDEIHGVIFPVTTTQQLRSFDLREVGYNRVCIPLKYIHVETEYGCDVARERAVSLQSKIARCLQNQHSKQENFHGISRMFSESEDEFYFQDVEDDVNFSRPNEIVDIRVWVYVPDPTYTALPNEDHPILQTYLDICIRGCLQWGGKELAKKFLQSTYHWSECFLNDAPLSRRPWIYRKDYSLIDQCLSECSEIVKYSCRKHPEEYASLHQTAFKPGQWGLPSRNSKFTGRDEYLRILHNKLTSYENVSSSIKQLNASSASLQQPISHFVINEVQIIGHGGVGKSQLTIEYAHRYLKHYYNFIAFIRAESFATISSDLRKLASDLDLMNQSKKKVHQVNLDGTSPLKKNVSFFDAVEQSESEISTRDELTLDDETIAEEIRKRLSRCRFKWLLIFDNVDDPSVLSLCVPRGVEGVGCGHVIVTSRISHPDWSSRGTILNLHCFDERESITFLRSSLSESFGPASVKEDKEINDIFERLAESLGYLPLALSTASVYMSRCDVHPKEYLQRLDSNTFSNARLDVSHLKSGTEVVNSQDALINCFGLTLDRIESEHPSARSVLSCLGYLAPDISKEMIHFLLCCGHFKLIGPQETISLLSDCPPPNPPLISLEPILPSSSVVQLSFNHMMVAFLFLICCLLFAHNSITFAFTTHNLSLICLGGIYGLLFPMILFIGFIMRDKSLKSLCPNLTMEIYLRDSMPRPQRSTKSAVAQLETVVSVNDETVRAQTDQLWHSFRQFSLISLVRDNGSGEICANRIGTIHRLQQSVLRARAKQSRNETLCLERSIWLLHTLWKFTPRDISTWKGSGDLIEHIQAITRHINDLYSSTGKTNLKDMYLHSDYLLILAKLLTNASQYTAIVLSKHDDSERLLQLSLNVISLIRDTLNGSSSQFFSDNVTQEMMLTQANTLHMLGKVCRYNGKLVESEKFLKKSLEISKTLLSMGKKTLELSQLHRDEIRTVLKNLSTVDFRREIQECDFSELIKGFDIFLSDCRDRSGTAHDATWEQLSTIQSRLGDTLHELGVLFLRTHHLQLSKSYLLSSLQVQSNATIMTTDCYSFCMNIASSLYQLGVIYTIEQKYNLAHLFLDYSLKLMNGINDQSCTSSDNGTYPLGLSIMSKAAIFQQLGKIEYRKGFLLKAKEYMFLALNIYHEIYGDSTNNYPTKSNINIACIHHQLGTIYSALHDYPSACEHLTKSLQIREIMLMEYKSGHILDYVVSLQAIGKAEVENRGYDSALTYFLRAKQLIEEELREVLGSNQRTTDSSAMMYRSASSSTAFVGIDMNIGVTEDDDIGPEYSNASSSPSYSISSSYRDLLTRQLESCLHSLKKITKLKEDYPQFQEYAKELKLLKKRDEGLFQPQVNQIQQIQDQLIQSLTLPSTVSLKLDSSMRDLDMELNGITLQFMEKLIFFRNDIRLWCVKSIKFLKQKSVENLEIDQYITLLRKDLFQFDEDLHGSVGINPEMMKILEDFFSGVRTILRQEIWGEVSIEHMPELRQQFNELLGYCDGVRSQLKQYGLILEDRK